MAQNANTTGFFGGIASAEQRPDANYLRPGAYTLEVLGLRAIVTRTQRRAFVAEFRVLDLLTTGPRTLAELADPEEPGCKYKLRIWLL
jgi:hypothetical protein